MNATMPRENEEQRAARYADLMRYPDWRVFAWKCKEARGFVCQTCAPGVGSRGEKGLEVHHWWYEQDRWPWDYAPEDVAVLCEPCHEALHAQLEAWKATTRARWQRSETELKRFVADFRRFVFPGLTPESFAALNMAIALGDKGSGGPLAALAIRGLMSGKEKGMIEHGRA